MATVKASFTDNSAKDGTNDLINGSEVDLNPELLADVLDGTQQTALGQSGNITFSDGSGVVIGHTAQATGIGEGAVTPEAQIIGTTETDSGLALMLNSTTDTLSPTLWLIKSGNATLANAGTKVEDDEELGSIRWIGADGLDFGSEAAKIEVFVDEGTGTGDMPGRLVFSTTANGAQTATERMRIDSAGVVTSAGLLSVDDTTESTSTTTGSIHTDGGLGVAGDIYAGDDIFLTVAAKLDFGGGNVTVTHGDNTLSVLSQTVDIAGAGALTDLRIDNTATDGDPILSFQLGGTSKFTVGVDDGDSDVLKIGTTAIGTGTMLRATAAGEITMPAQPAFHAYATANVANQIGDNATWATVAFAGESGDGGFDIGANYATPNFTAPVTGKYHLNANVYMYGITTACTKIILKLVTSNWEVELDRIADPSMDQTEIHLQGSVLVNMDAADTAYVAALAGGVGSNTIGFSGGTGDSVTHFSGHLVA
jgi:hypothetical protein